MIIRLKLKLNYSFSKYNGSDKKNNNIYKQKDFYLKGISLLNRSVFIKDLPYYINLLNEK